MLRAARLRTPPLRRRFCAKATSLGQAQALRPFLVEQYRGWTDPGVEFPSLSSSECEPLSLPCRSALSPRSSHCPPTAISLSSHFLPTLLRRAAHAAAATGSTLTEPRCWCHSSLALPDQGHMWLQSGAWGVSRLQASD